MRGGTSRAVFFHKQDLPDDKASWDAIFLSALGSPDSTGRQIDGIGGGVSSNSKVAVISVSDDPRYDVNFFFGQVAVGSPQVDYIGNCGNISSAVAPFAVDERLVETTGTITTVRIHQQNTDKLIIAEVNVKNGRFDEAGKYAIPGIGGTGSRVTLHFMDPGGSISGKLLPTGNALDRLTGISGVGDIDCSIVDAANPMVFVAAEDLGLDVADLGCFARAEVLEQLESIRARSAVLMRMADSEEAARTHCQAVPKIAVVSSPTPYETMAGVTVDDAETDVIIRCLSMGALHKAMPGTAAICAAGAAKIDRSIVNRAMDGKKFQDEMIRFGHPSGVMETGSEIVYRDGEYLYSKATIFRTARRIMEGYILVSEDLL